MLKRWLKIIKLNHGFSLVEALITIVIIGIALIPVSMVFTQTINTTVSTRKQLVANELGQAYIEAIKSKDISDVVKLFNGSSEIDNITTNFQGIGLVPLPDGYTAKISYDDSNSFKLPSLTSTTTNDLIDISVNIPSSYNNKVDITDVKSNTKVIYPHKVILAEKLVIIVNAVRVPEHKDALGNTVPPKDKVTLDLGEKGISDEFVFDTNKAHVIEFKMGNEEKENVVDKLIPLEIQISSNLASDIKIKIYEDETNLVKATTKVNSGSVSISRNLSSIDNKKKRIVSLKVEINDSISNKLLSTFKTTVVDE